MPRYTVTLEYTATISVEADDPEEAEEMAAGTDITKVIDSCGDCTIVHVEEE